MSVHSHEQSVTEQESPQVDHSDVITTDPAIQQLSEIRDLLFGQQVREIQSTIRHVQQDTTIHLDLLNQQFQQNLEQTRNEFNARLDALSQEMQARLQALQQSSEQADQRLERQLQDMANTLNETISRRAEELAHRLTQTQLELRDSKADRRTLASLLDRMASELNQDA